MSKILTLLDKRYNSSICKKTIPRFYTTLSPGLGASAQNGFAEGKGSIYTEKL